MYRLSLEDRTWSVHSHLLLKRKRYQAVILNSTVYVMGDTNECSRTLDSVELLDLSAPETK